jgi:hypothetical protein
MHPSCRRVYALPNQQHVSFASRNITHIHPSIMLLEDLRNTREDLERLEQAIAERSLEDPKHVRSFEYM